MSVAIVVQARMNSTRLPGKVLMPIADRPMLAYLIERLLRVRGAETLTVATTVEPADDPIVNFCSHQGVRCTRGSEHDVLRRFCEALEGLSATVVVRVTADCPLLGPDLVDLAIDAYGCAGEYDYVSNMLELSWPYGMAVEVFSKAALTAADRESRDPTEREHVTPFIYWRAKRFRLKSLKMHHDLSSYRWTVDTPEDFELISRILPTVYRRNPQFGIADVMAVLEQNPSWSQLNAHIQQKAVAPAKRS